MIDIFRKTSVYFFTFSIVLYLYYINFNLPFLAMDELSGNIFSFSEQLEHILMYGRSSHLFGFPINWFLSFKAPTLIELIPRFLSMILLLLVITYYLNHLKIDKISALLIVIFILGTHTLDWQHNGMIAFFGSYNAYLSCFIFAIILYERNHDRTKIVLNIVILILLLLSYASELFVGLSFVYILIGVMMFKSRKEITVLNPFILSIGIYVVVFAISRFMVIEQHSTHMANYVSGSFSTFSIMDIGKGFLLYFINSIPAYSEFDINIKLSSILSFLIIFCLVIIFITFSIKILKHNDEDYSKIFVYRHILLLITIALVPQVLMSFQPMKLEWILTGASNRYVFSFYTWIAIMLLASIFMKRINYNKVVTIFFSIVLVIFMIFSIQRNIKFIDEYKTSMANWLEIDDIFKKNLTNTKVVKVPLSLLEHPYISPVSVDYIKRYGKHFYQKDVLVCTGYGKFDFNDSKVDSILKLEGFSGIENFGRWTEGASAKIYFSQPLTRGSTIKLSIVNVFDQNSKLPVTFNLGQIKESIVIESNKDVFLTIQEDIKEPVLKINIPKPNSPKALGISNDTRMLGIAIKKIEIGTIEDKLFKQNLDEVCK